MDFRKFHRWVFKAILLGIPVVCEKLVVLVVLVSCDQCFNTISGVCKN